MIKSLITTTLFFFAVSNLTAQTGYSNYIQQVGRLQKLHKQYPQLSNLQSIGKTGSGKDIWMLILGSGKESSGSPLCPYLLREQAQQILRCVV